MNALRLLRDLVRRGWRWCRVHGVASALERWRGLVGARRWPPWRSYLKWIRAHEPHARLAPRDASRPEATLRVSVVVPVRDPDPAHFDALVASLQVQDLPEWQLCLVDDGSRDPRIAGRLAELARQDPRVVLVRHADALGIGAASNAAAAMACAEVLVFVDHDDVLAPGALRRVAEAFASDARLDLAYTDEDQLVGPRLRVAPVVKPGASPFLLLGHNYVTHLMSLRRSLFEALGGFRPDYDGSQDHDLALRAFERARGVRRLPGFHYHWRRAPGSVAAGATAKAWAYEAGRRAVADACLRRGLPIASVSHAALPGVYELHPRPLPVAITCDVVLRGPARGCAAWTLALGSCPELRPHTITRNAWPAEDCAHAWLVIDAELEPDPAPLRALLAWSALPGIGALAAPACTSRRRGNLGWTVNRAGFAQPVLPGLVLSAPGPGLIAACPHEVAAAGGGLLWVATPPEAWRALHAGRPASLAGELGLSMAHAVAGLPTLLLPGCRPRRARGKLPTAAPVDLSVAPGWSLLDGSLPEAFWAGATDRFCPRHELLAELGVPSPESGQSASNSV
jgi:hypothetical protein